MTSDNGELFALNENVIINCPTHVDYGDGQEEIKDRVLAEQMKAD